MQAAFLYIANRSILSIGLIVIVLLLRCIFRNGSKFIRCILWGLAGVLLLFPLSISGFLSGNGVGDALVGIRSVTETSSVADNSGSYNINSDTDGSDFAISGSDNSDVAMSDEQKENSEAGSEWNTMISAGNTGATTGNSDAENSEMAADTRNVIAESSDAAEETVDMEDSRDSWKNRLFHEIQLPEYMVSVLSVIWLAGCVLLCLYLLVGHALMKRRVRICMRRDREDGESDVWLCDDIDSPFLFGYLQPRIFIPSDMEEWQISYVTAHETVHRKRRDYIWKTAAFLVAALHWFNPFVWVAFCCFCADLELSCDEKATEDMSGDDRALYAKALVVCSSQRKVTPVHLLAFGKNAVKERIRVIMKKRVSGKKKMICNLLACVLFSVSFFAAAAAGTNYVSFAEESSEIITIVWAVPESDTTMFYGSGVKSWYKETDRLNADLLNEQLEADGYSLRLEVKYIPWGNDRSEFIETGDNEVYPAEDYYVSLKEVLEDGTADIISCVSIGSDAISELVRCGYLANLSDYLDSDKGLELKNVFYEELWESVCVDNSLCLLPAALAENGTGYYAFNKAYFTEEDLAAFDGTAQSLLQLLENSGEENLKVIWGADIDSLAYSAGQQYTDGVLLDLETGRVRSLAGSEAFLEEADAIRSMRENGYFGEDGISYQPETTVSATKAGLERGVAVWVGVNATEVSDEVKDDVILVQMPYAYSNTLGYNVAVSSQSDCQEAALDLLTLLYTNEDYANLLIWGEEGTDYEVTDGTATALTERAASISTKQFWTGLYDGIWSASQEPETLSETTESLQTKTDLYNDTGKKDSTVTDFCIDRSEFDEEMSAFSDTATQAAYAYLKGNIDLEEFAERLEEAGGENVRSQISRQMTKWEKSKRQRSYNFKLSVFTKQTE